MDQTNFKGIKREDKATVDKVITGTLYASQLLLYSAIT